MANPTVCSLFTVALTMASGAAAAAPTSTSQESKVAGDRFGAYAMDRAEGVRLARLFAGLDTFPIKLSALEKIVGRRLGAHFTSESRSAGFEHDGRGPIGPNVGGTPIDHRAKDAPMLLELRSQYHARYDDDGRFRNRPPTASDDPLIDRIEISDSYAHGPPPEIEGLKRFDNLVYLDSGEFWRARKVPPGPWRKHQGFLAIAEKEENLRQPDERWNFKVSVERGAYFDAAEVTSGLAPLLELISAINSKKEFAPIFTDWKAKYAQHDDLGTWDFGLISHNPRYFSVKFTEGPYQGDFLKGEGRTASLYVNTYVNTHAGSEARVSVPALFAALGMKRARVTEEIPTPAPFREPSHALVYYNRVTAESGPWRVSMSGFHAMKDGKVVTDIDLATFMPGSISLTWHQKAGG